ncbi:MAG: alpha-2-macroglobulin family protein, partial [Candidatus Aminicenantes bacterium]|nr:alpha-2-macroglobulin family protein [Candidatus Aminicenantes bacterium]
MQLSDGSWPWFSGGPGNHYITLYIVTGFGRLRHLGVDDIPLDLTGKAIQFLDNWILEVYNRIVAKGYLKSNNLGSRVALYLYGRSYYLKKHPLSSKCQKAVDYFLQQAREYWLKLSHRQNQAQLALALNRFGDSVIARKIMHSIKERSRFSEELGRYWRETELSWWWFRAPIETQAVMIEAFDEIMGDLQAVKECKVWLLKQKQARDWKTTKATADAVYAVVLRGDNLLASDLPVEVTLGSLKVEIEKPEAGTGYYEKIYQPRDIVADMGRITVSKKDKGIAWGGVHWQYLEDISKITPHTANPLKLKKRLFVRRFTDKGPMIEPYRGSLGVGDLLVVRIELRTDRDMEYIHMKDHRGSGLEPVNVLSRYKFQDGLAYYESTLDTATHFFIDYLPKGTYVFEYPLRVVHRGRFQSGMAHIECMYAPEFNSHSQSFELKVK